MYILSDFASLYLARVISKDVNVEDNTVEINLNINLDPNEADDVVDAPLKDVSSSIHQFYIYYQMYF